VSQQLAENEIERAAAQLLEDAIASGRLAQDPSPEILVKVANIVRGALSAGPSNQAAHSPVAESTAVVATGGHCHASATP
jgi:hypothetical protein